MRFRAVIAVFVLSVCPLTALAGDLNPPPGPVRPTMVSLDALEPRICLNDLPGDEGATVLVTEPGNYFLRADLEGEPGKHGVRIVAQGDVAIDMSGCRIWGVAGSLDGINFERPPGGAPVSLTVSFSRAGDVGRISDWGGDGIRTQNVTTCVCTHLLVEDNGGNGITHLHAENVIHRDIATRNNGGHGVSSRDAATGLPTGKRQHGVIRCTSSGNGGDGFSITNATEDFELLIEGGSSSSNRGGALNIEVADASARGISSGGEGMRIRVNRFECARNDGQGVRIELPSSNRAAISMTETSCVGNLGDGLEIVGGIVQGRHHGHVTVLKLCEFANNGGNGTVSDNPLYAEGCTWVDNAIHGMVVNAPTPTELAARCVNGTFADNGAGGVRCGPGRFQGVACLFTDNTGSGISCTDGCVVLDRCDITRSTLCGVEAIDSTINMTSCTLRRNDEAGCKKIRGSVVMSDTTCELNGMGAVFEDCTTVTMTRCVFNDNTGAGVQNRSNVGPVRWMAPECIASRNGSHGFDLRDVDGGTLDRCVASGNGGNGFELGQKADRCRVERCTSTANGGVGFNILGSGNLIVGNRATGGAVGGYNIGAGNVRGPILTAATLVTNTNPDANIEY